MPAVTKLFSAQGRPFAVFPAAVQAVVVDPHERFLLLHGPRHPGWQVVSGALEAEETVLAGAWREAREELGAAVQLRPLGTVHVETFAYDSNLPFVLSLNYLFAYEGGAIVPGDDMLGAQARWWTWAELNHEPPLFHPSTHLWLLGRALQLYRLWHMEPNPTLQRPL